MCAGNSWFLTATTYASDPRPSLARPRPNRRPAGRPALRDARADPGSPAARRGRRNATRCRRCRPWSGCHARSTPWPRRWSRRWRWCLTPAARRSGWPARRPSGHPRSSRNRGLTGSHTPRRRTPAAPACLCIRSRQPACSAQPRVAGIVRLEDRVLHGLAGDGFGLREGAAGEVARRQPAHAVLVHDDAGGAVVLQALHVGDVGDGFGRLARQGGDGLRVRHADLAVAAHCDGFQVLAAHHRAHSGAAVRTVGHVNDHGSMESFSPAGPVCTTRSGGLPTRSSRAARLPRFYPSEPPPDAAQPAHRGSTGIPGLLALPVITRASNPANFSSAGKNPPAWLSPMRPEVGLLAVAVQRLCPLTAAARATAVTFVYHHRSYQLFDLRHQPFFPLSL